MKKLIIIILGLLPLTTIYAQTDSTLNRTIVVENEYNPTVIDASKVNVLPKVEEPTVAKKTVEYATTSRKIIGWTKESMIPIERDMMKEKASRGYLNAGYGNYGNALLDAGYLWDITNVDRLKVDFLLNGMNGNIYCPMHKRSDDWNSRWYDTKVKVFYNHVFKPVTLNIGGSYMSQVYNYLGIDSANSLAWVGENKHQHNTVGDVFVSIASCDKDLPFQYKLQTGFLYFSQKYSTFGSGNFDTGFYVINEESSNNHANYKPDKDIEKKIHTEGEIWTGLKEEQYLGLAFGMDNMIYSPSRMPNYTSILLNPYYTIEGDVYRAHLGAHIDWLSGDNGGVDFAPNVKAEYIFQNSYILYVNIDGGRQLNDYGFVNGISRYWKMDEFLKPSYTQVDAKIGFRASPMSGLWFNVYGGYRMVSNDIYSLSTLKFNEPNKGYYTVSFVQSKSKVSYFGAELRYSYKDLFEIGINGLYQGWKTNGLFEYTDDVLLYYAPKFKMDIYAKGKVYAGLNIDGGLKYIKRYSNQLNDVNDLHVGANYEILKNISVFGQVHNLLNKEYGILGYPQEKLNFLAGIKLRF
ncbi:TonB-dependent receptor [Phocaeicola oris]|uniref:TonB-dependent receptor n=1 Tax=Phocaeicola oris TaxID=2896850 RepID=UPI00234EF229|nr:TonB-dependent receptor [Phocaeicola oris]MCE2616887.1 TonB-dependent receptor [Phocaeicola oris]